MTPPVETFQVFKTWKVCAYRRTYFAERLDDLCGQGLFGALLRSLAPAEHARVRGGNPNAYAVALVRYIDRARLFPINAYLAYEIESGEHGWDDLLDYGIPVVTFGCDWEDDAVMPDVAVCLQMSRAEWLDDNSPTALDPYRELLARHLSTAGKPPRLPRGRVWREPWDATGTLFEWATGTTGNRWLDYTGDLLNDGGLPRWNLGELRSLAADWARTEPVYKRLKRLHKFINAKPRATLPLLAGALAGDANCLRAITRPARGAEGK